MIEKVVKGEHINDMGMWIVYEDLTMDLIEPSEEWLEKLKEMEEESKKPTPPTPIESLAQDVEVVAEMVSTVMMDSEIAKEDFGALAEAIAMIMLELDDVRTSMSIPGEV